MRQTDKAPTGNSTETKARIIEAAQIIFSQKGYPHAGLREIAGRAGVATSLVLKYFGTKANLFEEALSGALIAPEIFQADRSSFGRAIVDVVLDPNLNVNAPSMIALSLGDEEAREIASRVSRNHILAPMEKWLTSSQPHAQAAIILMMTMGLAIFSRHMSIDDTLEARDQVSQRVAKSLQAIIDGDDVT